MNIKDQRVLVAFCHDWMGLANRMKCFVSAQVLAKETNRTLLVYWEPTDMCCARFEDLFLNKVSRVYYQELLSCIENYPFKIVEDVTSCKKSSAPYIIFSSPYFAVKPLVFEPALKALQPLPYLSKRLSSLSKANALSSCIGVHIRRSDFTKDHPYNFSSDNFFITEIDRQIKAEPKSRFYLCTDDSNTEKVLSKRYGPRMLIRKKVFARTSLKGIQDSLLDLYLLAATKSIIGTIGSTFTQTAFWLGDSNRKLSVSSTLSNGEAFKLDTFEINPHRQMNFFAFALSNDLLAYLFKEGKFKQIIYLLTLPFCRNYLDFSRNSFFDNLNRLIGICGKLLSNLFPSVYLALKAHIFKRPLLASSHNS